MHIVFLSEHYYPRIGGVTTYVEKTCGNLSSQGCRVTLLVPSEGAGEPMTETKNQNWTIVYLPAGVLLTKDIAPNVRIRFANDSAAYIEKLAQREQIAAIHILFGLYLMRYFSLAKIKGLGIKAGVTIHNVPPAECGNSWTTDRIDRRIKDFIRKKGVEWVNKRRICAQNFDFYIVPSKHVKDLLQIYLPKQAIYTIGHGTDNELIKATNLASKQANERFKILTVGGFVPHKNQHLALEAAHILQQKGIDFEWHCVGPVRNQVYFDFLQQQLKAQNNSNFYLHQRLPFDELQHLYATSDVYVQPSSEEGFCLTALDAAFYALPIVGTKTGAIPEIIQQSSGCLVSVNAAAIANAILEVIQSHQQFKQKTLDAQPHLLTRFTWQRAAEQLIQTIQSI
jgi:glycosyltransferase involved in cell wall biosynthesis